MIIHYKYCPTCGAALHEQADEEGKLVPHCPGCGAWWYDSFPSCVIILTYTEDNEVLLTMQDHLSKLHACFNSGYIMAGENAEEAAVRELQEELGLKPLKLTYDRSYWYAKRGQLMHAFFALAEKQELHLNEEIRLARWVPMQEARQYLGVDRIPQRVDVSMLRGLFAQRGLDWTEEPVTEEKAL